MKSFTQLLVLAVASLSMVAAAAVSQEDKFEPCTPCTTSSCSSESYPRDIVLTEDKPKYEPAIVIYRTFVTPETGLKAVFSFEGGSHSALPAGLITSSYKDQEVVVTVNMVSERYTSAIKSINKSSMAFEIKPNSTCKVGFPENFFPLNIKTVVMSTDEP